MKLLRQFGVILTVSFLGEILNYLIPLPVPASIYGLVLMLLCLMTGLIRLEWVRETGHFLVEIMPLMFIPAAVGLIDAWDVISSHLVAYLVITVLSTLAVILASGQVTQHVMRREAKGRARQ